jgi:DNA polymerase
MPRLWFDLETYSTVPIKHGSHAYAEKAEVLLFAYALDDGPVGVWDVTAGGLPPRLLIDAAEDPTVEWWGHNAAMFDWVVLAHAMPEFARAVPLHRRFDTMVQAYSHGLPGALDSLCEVMNLPQDLRKHKEGKALVRLFCMPPPKTVKRGRATRHTHPEEWQQFIAYAGGDIVSMRALTKKMPSWNYPGNAREVELHQMDMRMNQRGMTVDLDLAHAAVEMATAEKKRLAERTRELTDDEVQSATKRDQLLAHLLKSYGVELPDLQGATIERRMADPDLPDAMRELLGVRLQASATSATKYTALINAASSDGRLRGTLQFCGAARTGRWAGRLFQPQNLSRVPKYVAKLWEDAIASIKGGSTPLIFDNVMEVVGSCVRGCIVAPPGKKLVVADLSNIEGRMLAWLAGEEWKLQAFREFDAGVGPDLYKLAYSKSFGVTVDQVDDGDQRQIGKVQELALGYEGGVGAFLTFAAAYGIDLDDMAEQALPALPDWAVREAGEFYDWTVRQKRSAFGLSRRTFVACDAIKRAWRAAHPETVAFWRELGDAVKAATLSPGLAITVRRLHVQRTGAWLRIRLPSGRFLCYPSPRVDDGQFSYMGVNQYTRKWERIKSYSGKLAENVTQAAARDQIAWGMLLAEQNGYPPITSIHDEAPTEVPDEPEYTEQQLSAYLAAEFAWNKGLPLAAAGFQAYRYRKG